MGYFLDGGSVLEALLDPALYSGLGASTWVIHFL